MNIKKISVPQLFLMLIGSFGLFATSQSFAIPTAISDIDLDDSYMQVSFTEESGTGNGGRFTCFGETSSPAIKSFADIGITEASLPDATLSSVDNCFQQAGDYTVLIHLEDRAGNSTDQSYQYRVKAGMPEDAIAKGFRSIFTQSSCTDILANNSDECVLNFELRDAFGNPVTQIENIEMVSRTSALPHDANTETSFLAGLRFNEAVNGESFDLVSLPKDGIFPLDIKAFAPSVAIVGTYFSQLVGHVLNFEVSVSQIGSDGAIESEEVVLFLNTNPIRFRNPFALRPSILGFSWEGENTTTGTITLDLVGGSTPSTRYGELTALNDKLSYSNLPTNSINLNISEPTTSFTMGTTLSPVEDAVYEEDQQLAFVTKIAYQIGGQDIAYSAGGSGKNDLIIADGVSFGEVIGYNANVAVPIVGADIEGGIIGSLERMEIQPKAGIDTFNVSESTAKLRDQITENVYRLSRGSSNILDESVNKTFNPSWFTDYDVVIVQVEDDNVIFPEGAAVPEGKNTLIIKNGNFIVAGDMTYQNLGDSFGVILMNDAQNDPANGNIFVRPDVKTMVGSYYADGGLMTNDETMPSVTGLNNVAEDNFTQLLLTGTLFSQNTLGGSIKTNNAGNYFTPWGTTSVKEDARKYDLHYVRRYQETLTDVNGNTEANWTSCVPKKDEELESAANCDDNKNAFVIRIDRKASIAPPPGFETTGSIIR